MGWEMLGLFFVFFLVNYVKGFCETEVVLELDCGVQLGLVVLLANQ
jgi:hypothetical protein